MTKESKLDRLRSVTWVFLLRDLKSRYANSFLGPVWVILQPLALIGITVIIFSVVFASQPGEIPYFLHVMIGYIHWLFFSQTLSKTVYSLEANGGLIKNHRFPLLAIPLSVLLSRLIDYLVGLGLILLAMYALHFSFSIQTIILFLSILFIQILFQFGLSLLLATFNVFARDLQYLVEIVLQLWFYATPVIYRLELLPSNWQPFLYLNPLTTLFQSYRQLIIAADLPSALGLVIFISFFVFSLGLWAFDKYQPYFAEKL